MSAGQCDEKDRLVLDTAERQELYSAAVAELSRRIGITSLDDYLQLHQAAERARMRSNEARDRVAQHLAEHHC